MGSGESASIVTVCEKLAFQTSVKLVERPGFLPGFDVESGPHYTIDFQKLTSVAIATNRPRVKQGKLNHDYKATLMQPTRFYTALLASLLFSATASAQVFDNGPDNPTLFTNVFNLPGDVLFEFNGPFVFGDTDSPTQLNVANGGFLAGSASIQGVELNVSSGGVVGGFLRGFGSEINISGGTVGSFAEVSGGFPFTGFGGSVVNISGGTVDGGFLASDDTVVNISGGSVGGIRVDDDSVLNISGGSVRELTAGEGNVTVNISGGTVGGIDNLRDAIDIRTGAVVNISGGSFPANFDASSGSNINLFGRDFALDGVLLDDLNLGEAFTIDDRNETLSGLLVDGSAFSFDLNDPSSFPNDEFDTDATITVTLTAVPEPTSTTILLLGCGLAGMRRRRLVA